MTRPSDITLSPGSDGAAFERLCTIGLRDPSQRRFTIADWLGERDAKGRVQIAGVHEHIRRRFMVEHNVSIGLSS